MQYRNKLAALLVALVISVVLAACGGDSSTATPAAGGNAGSATPAAGGATPATGSSTPAAAGSPQPISKSFGNGSIVVNLDFTPSASGTKVIGSAGPIADYLAQKTGYKFNVTVPTSYQADIEALGSGNTDISFLSPYAYVLANQRYGVIVKLATVRKGQASYPSVIIAKDPNIKTIQDLKGKKFAFVDTASAAGYLYPYAYLKANIPGFDPSTYFSQVINAGSHDKVVKAVFNGDVDAGAIFGNQSDPKGDARLLVVKDIPTIFEATHIVATTDLIPNDTVSCRKDMVQSVCTNVINTLLDYSKTTDGQKALYALYQIDGLTPTNDAAYDPIRLKAQQAGVDIGKAVK